MSEKVQTVGPIKFIEKFSKNEDYQQTVIMMHGFGADMYDLASLSDYLQISTPTRWLFPQGFLETPIGPGWTGRAWWSIDIQKWEEKVRQTGEMDLSESVPEGLEKARTTMLAWMAKMKINPAEVILSGFSQGSMLATDLSLHLPMNVKALMVFSGNLLNKQEWSLAIPSRKGTPFFQSHGTRDPVLSFKGAQRLETFLTQNGYVGKLTSFEGAHEIPPSVLSSATRFLENLA